MASRRPVEASNHRQRSPRAGAPVVELVSSGGFAGLIRSARAQLSELDPILHPLIHDLLARADRPVAAPPAADPRRDIRNYDLKIDDGRRCYTASFAETDVPAELAPLVATMRPRCKP